MDKNSTYQQKFSQLEPWMPSVIHAVKKDLRNEHLKNDVAFVRQHFQTKNPAKITVEEMIAVYPKLVVAGNEALGEFLSTRWLLKHGDLYQSFEQALSQINPNFAELEEIDSSVAQAMMRKAVEDFGAVDTYLFCVLNSVVFPDSVYRQLEEMARQQSSQEAAHAASENQARIEEQSHRELTLSIARLTDRYEKKLAGLEKKYLLDTEALRRQVANLQRKLADATKGS